MKLHQRALRCRQRASKTAIASGPASARATFPRPRTAARTSNGRHFFGARGGARTPRGRRTKAWPRPACMSGHRVFPILAASGLSGGFRAGGSLL